MKKIVLTVMMIAVSAPAFSRKRNMFHRLVLTDIIKMQMASASTNRPRFRMKVPLRFAAMVFIPMRHAGRISAPITAVLPSC